MKPVLVAVLIAFAAPASAAESVCGVEEAVVLESKASSVRAPLRKPVRQEPSAPVVRRSVRTADVVLPPRDPSGWPPRLFSRPPPLF